MKRQVNVTSQSELDIGGRETCSWLNYFLYIEKVVIVQNISYFLLIPKRVLSTEEWAKTRIINKTNDMQSVDLMLAQETFLCY